MGFYESYEAMSVFDNVWGEIVIPADFVKVLRHPTVQALKFKKQLGMTVRNPKFTGGFHTRYDHAIGVYYIATKLIAACKLRFGDAFKITKKEENAFYLSALLHDLGHRVGSHAFERIAKTSHENETYAAILSMQDFIDSIFGEGTCKYIIEILNDKNRVKKEIAQREGDKIDLLFVLSELMVGSVDIDRIDYISRDYLNIYGERKDFSLLFNYMELELINNRPKIVFNEGALIIIEDYLITRFRLYNDVHFHPYVMIQDEYFKKFVLEHFRPEDIDVNYSETKMNYLISTAVSCVITKKRYIDVLDYGDFSKIRYKKFNSKEQAEVFSLKLSTLIDIKYSIFCGYLSRKVTVYDKEKNSIFIKSGSEINDITELSRIIKDKISQNTICIYVDLELLENAMRNSGISQEDVLEKLKQVVDLFEKSDKEIEYKFTVVSEKRKDIILNTVAKYSKLSDREIIQNNYDVYYLIPGFEPKDGSIRIRKVEGSIKPTIKFSLKDGTSITKRDEHNFSDLSETEFLKVASDILKARGVDVPDDLNDYQMVMVNTARRLYRIQFNSSVIELALDKSIYRNANEDKTKFDTMIEVELKQGNTLDLWEFVNELKAYLGKDGLVDCSESKLSRAIRMLNE